MSAISTWIISIAGVVILSVVIDLILPESKMRVYVRSVFAFVVIMVIVSPLPRLIGSDFSLDTIFGEQNEQEIQTDFIYQLNRDKLTALENAVEEDLSRQGIDGVQIIIGANIFTTQLEIDAVFVELSDIVLNENTENIDINETIVKTIKSKINVKKESIVFNE